MTCPFEVNDGAYILGALAPADRAEFEHHLAVCPACRASVAALAVLPGLLGRLDPATLVPAATAPPGLLPRVLSTARTRRRAQRQRQLLTMAAACVATAALATAVGLGVQLLDRSPDSAVLITPDEVAYFDMHPAGGYVPLDAEIAIRQDPTGTLVAVRCLYHAEDQPSWPIWLVVYSRDETEVEVIGSWLAIPGDQIEVTGVTYLAPAQIGRIELQDTDHQMVAWWSP